MTVNVLESAAIRPPQGPLPPGDMAFLRLIAHQGEHSEVGAVRLDVAVKGHQWNATIRGRRTHTEPGDRIGDGDLLIEPAGVKSVAVVVNRKALVEALEGLARKLRE
jgi:hypothetical protein